MSEHAEQIEDGEWNPVDEERPGGNPAAQENTSAEIVAVPPEVADDDDDQEDGDGQQGFGHQGHQPSNAQILIALVFGKGVALFHDKEPRPYATFEQDGHFETWPLRSRTFKLYLRKLFYDETGASLPAQDLTDTLELLAARAIFDGQEYPVFLRVAECDGAIYVDLCDDEWQVVKITPDGWTVESKSPVRFRRAPGMEALPVPEPGGSVDELHQFLNVEEDGFLFYVAWLLVAYDPNSPFVVLVAYGEQGSAKSTAGRVVRKLIDPNKADLRRPIHNSRDLVIAANNSAVITLDNISHLTDGVSDDLCRLATGGGFSARTLYTDEDETIFEVQRPVIINGIEEPATRGDLVDRSFMVEHPQIPEGDRVEEKEFWADFEVARPRILGALFDAVSGALRDLPTTHRDRWPRMADAARWVSAAEATLGWEPGSFLDAYEVNRNEAQGIVVEAALIGPALLRLGAFEGTATELLAALSLHVDEKTLKLKDWPGTARKVGGELDRLAPALRLQGWNIERSRRSGGSRERIITITPPTRASTSESVPTVPSSRDGSVEPDLRDGRDATGRSMDGDRPAQEPHSQADWDGRDGRDGVRGASSGLTDDDVDGLLFDRLPMAAYARRDEHMTPEEQRALAKIEAHHQRVAS
jgi:hypothetical protein